MEGDGHTSQLSDDGRKRIAVLSRILKYLNDQPFSSLSFLSHAANSQASSSREVILG